MNERTLYSALWLLTGDGGVHRDGAMLVVDGRIAGIGRKADFGGDVRVVDLGAAVILPGLVNVHSHPELAAFRGLLDDLPFHQWIPTLMRCKRGAQLTAEDYEVCALWTCVESVRAGITTIGATEDSGAAMQALTAAGMRGVVYLETFGPAPEQVQQSIADLRAKVDRCSALATEHVRIGVSPHAPYTVSDELYQAVGEFARGERLPVATHAAEAEGEELLVRDGLGPFAGGLRTRGIETPPRAPSTIQLLKRTGVLDLAPMIIHGVRVSADDLADIASAGASIAHCPVANARLGHGIAPIVEARERGIRIGIGTDSVASNNRIDILEEARIAQVAQRARLLSASALPAADLLSMCTLDSARMLGLDFHTGSLQTGKSADFCVVRLQTSHTTPAPEPLNTVFHAARGSDVVLTVAGGQVLYEDGRVPWIDEVELRGRVEAVGRRLHEAK